MMNKRILSAALVAALWSCEPSTLTELSPSIEVEPESIEFVGSNLGVQRRVDVVVKNTGGHRLELRSATVDGDGAFSLVGEAGVVAPGASRRFEVIFTAKTASAVEGRLRFASDDPNRPVVEVPLTARPERGPVLTICASSLDLEMPFTCASDLALDFETFRTNETRRATIRVQSEGTEAVTVEPGGLDGGGAFVMADYEGRALEPGAFFDVEIAARLETEATVRAQLDVVSDAGTRSVSMSATGAAIDLCFRPDPVDFGAVPPDEQRERTIAVSSCAGGSSEIDRVEVLGDAFSTTESFDGPVTVSDSLHYRAPLSFAPASLGEHAGRFRVHTERGSAQVALLGRGAKCILAAQPAALDLKTRLGTSAHEQIELENVGKESCRIERVMPREGEVVVEGDAAAFELLPGDTKTIVVGYTPIDLDGDHVDVTLANEAGVVLGIPVRAQAIDTACTVAVEPAAIDFGVVEVGTLAAASVTLTVTEGTCALIGASINGGFTLAEISRGIIDGAVSAAVAFEPSVSGEASGRLELRTNAGLSTVSIRATAKQRALCIDPEHVAFGETAAPAVRTIQLTACGDAPVVIDAVDFVEHDPEIDFAAPFATPTTLRVGETTTIDVRYTPADEEADTAFVRVQTDGDARDVRVTGGPEIVDVTSGAYLYFWRIDPPAFGQAPDVSSDVVRLPLQGRPVIEPMRGPNAEGGRCSGCHTLSPDGRFLAVIDAWYDDDEEEALHTRLAIVDTDSGQEVRPGLPNVSWMSWRPDVDADPPYQFVYGAAGDLHRATILGDLGPIAGADLPDQIETMPTWGPNGAIAFVRTEGSGRSDVAIAGPTDLVVIDEQGGVATPIPGASGGDVLRYYPRFAPDGRFISFTETTEIELGSLSNVAAKIRMVPASGGAVLPLAGLNAGDGANSYATWSPDGRYLSFGSDRLGGHGSYDLYLTPMGPDGPTGSPVNLSFANTAAYEHAAEWSR